MRQETKALFKKVCEEYNLTLREQIEIYKIIRKLMYHREFYRRTTDEFLHHGNVTLGEHIFEDVVNAYLICKKTNKIVDLELTLKIAMMHDLYTKPWQNSGDKKSELRNCHGFSHPLEAAINSMVWYKNEFKNPKKAEILLDGILHHMYPFPVLSYTQSGCKDLELNNIDMVKQISSKNLRLLIKLSNRYSFQGLSYSRSKYIEGRIMSRADKIATVRELSNLSDYKALVTGKNKVLLKVQ